MLCELEQIASRPTSDFEDPLPCVFAKLRPIAEPGIDGVSLLLSQKQGRLVPMILGKLRSVGHHILQADKPKEFACLKLIYIALQTYCVATIDSICLEEERLSPSINSFHQRAKFSSNQALLPRR